MRGFLTVFLFLLSLYFVAVLGDPVEATVRLESGKFVLDTSGAHSDGVAWGKYSDSLFSTGWNEFTVSSNCASDPVTQGKAIGYLEGALAAKDIYNQRSNLMEFVHSHWLGGKDFSEKEYAFTQQQEDWIRNQVAINPKDSFWQTVAVFLAVHDGLVQGFEESPFKTSTMKINASEFWIYQNVVDMLDLGNDPKLRESHLRGSNWYDNVADEPNEFTNAWTIRNRCSGLVKLLNDDLYTSQVTWMFFGNMNRVLKSQTLCIDEKISGVATKLSRFSGYPGFINSGDSFYTTDAGLTIFETTFSVFNSSLFEQYLTHKSLPVWLRASVASVRAGNGPEWAEAFSKFNSGTYNNQWIIVDYKKFAPGRSSQPKGLLTVSEQVPGFVVTKDRTEELSSDAYFPSYNTPSFSEIIDLANYTETIKAGGPSVAFWTDPVHCCRANIFRRDAPSVKDMDSMKHMMRYNDWQNDPLSIDPKYGKDPGAAIASRYDLRPSSIPRGMAFGALDAKISSVEMMKEGSFLAISGPTEQQELFSFSEAQYPCPHKGLPDSYNFDWIKYEY